MQRTQQKHTTIAALVIAGIAAASVATTVSAAGVTLGGNAAIGADAMITTPVPGATVGGAAEAQGGASADLDSNAAMQGLERARERVDSAQDRARAQAEDLQSQAREARPGARAESGVSARAGDKRKR